MWRLKSEIANFVGKVMPGGIVSNPTPSVAIPI